MTKPNRLAPDGDAARVLGRLEATVVAIEDRIERLEVTSAARMSAIEQKLDGVVNARAQSLGAMKLMHWIGGGLLAVAGFLANNLFRQFR